MGFASYLEDISERFSSNFQNVCNDVENGNFSHETRAKLESLLQQCERSVYQLLEIATNPNIETASEIYKLREEIKKLNDRIGKFESEIKELRKENEKQSNVINNKNEEIKNLKEEIDFLKNQDEFYQELA